jgi:ferrous iron transport protein A
VPNAEVEMVRCATLGDPLEMRVGDYYVTLRKREADLIEVCAA